MAKKVTEYTPIIEILKDILGEYRSHNDEKGQISFDCPVCSHEIKGLEIGDGKGNLEINYKHSVYKCWVCSETYDTHGSVYKLIKKYGSDKQLKKYKLLRPDEDIETEIKVYKPVKLPDEYISFTLASDEIKNTYFYKLAKKYLEDRGVTDEIIKKFFIGYCPTGLYYKRIIIPSFNEEGDLNYFIARTFDPKIRPKYKNPETRKELIIWNELLLDWNKPIYLVEGAFDCIFLPNSIPMLGKVLHEKLFSMIYEKAIEVIVVLDGDAYENTLKIYHKLNGGRLYGKIWFIKLPIDLDIADLRGNLDNYEKKQLN